MMRPPPKYLHLILFFACGHIALSEFSCIVFSDALLYELSEKMNTKIVHIQLSKLRRHVSAQLFDHNSELFFASSAGTTLLC